MDNMRLWSTLGRTDPDHTKQFKRAGGFSGTALKPMWVVRRLTEQFGPCGDGWGVEEPHFQVVPGENREVLVFCTVAGWYREGDAKHSVWGVGGDKVVTHIKANEQYKRPERWESDDEAFKKAFTDAMGNAFKFVGVGADIHMGQFDDSKYVAAVREEFRAANDAPDNAGQGQSQGGAVSPGQRKREPLKGPVKTRAEIRIKCGELVRELHGCADADMLDIVLNDNRALIEQVSDEVEFFWKGDGADFIGLEAEIAAARGRVSEDWKTNKMRAG